LISNGLIRRIESISSVKLVNNEFVLTLKESQRKAKYLQQTTEKINARSQRWQNKRKNQSLHTTFGLEATIKITQSARISENNRGVPFFV